MTQNNIQTATSPRAAMGIIIAQAMEWHIWDSNDEKIDFGVYYCPDSQYRYRIYLRGDNDGEKMLAGGDDMDKVLREYLAKNYYIDNPENLVIGYRHGGKVRKQDKDFHFVAEAVAWNIYDEDGKPTAQGTYASWSDDGMYRLKDMDDRGNVELNAFLRDDDLALLMKRFVRKYGKHPSATSMRFQHGDKDGGIKEKQ
ncbi:MAG: hypothetical protein ACR2PR_11175 [Pseudohongiellaceae bacterium]